jgi:4'-phosphopantetheinyl transferase
LKVRIYFANVFKLLDVFPKAFNLLTPERKAKTLRYRKEDDRLRSLCAGLLLRRHLNVRNDDDMTTDDKGRPRLKAEKPRLSISHSGSLCALAVSDGTVGLDLEYLGREIKEDGLARRVLTPEEYAVYAQRLKDPEYFFSVWTRKESVMKATGMGLSLDPASIRVIPLSKEEHFVMNGKWWFQTFEVADHIFSVCGSEGPLDVNLTENDAEDLLADPDAPGNGGTSR